MNLNHLTAHTRLSYNATLVKQKSADDTLMQVKSICRMLQESILQYFQPSLSYHLPLRPFFVYFWVAA